MSIVKRIFRSGHDSGESQDTVDLDSLFKEYYDRLVYFSFQLVKDKDRAQDIVQDSFIKYWYQRETVMPDKTAVKNFLYISVRNASLNALKHAKVEENYIQRQCVAELEVQPVINAIIAAEVMAGIHSAIQSLPENYRVISVMGYLEGKKNHEIAGELEMSVNTVKKQKYKALHLLKGKLAPEIFVFLFAMAIEILK
jgi:RNA polymerase sigma-70 factor (family 1)